MPDFGGGTTVLQDAYIDGNYTDRFKIRVGKFKGPVGLERLQSGTALSFKQIFGDVLGGTTEYQVGIFNGVADGGSSDTDTNNGKEGAARIFAQPFKNTDWDFAKGLGLGIAYSWGRQQGSATTSRATRSRRTTMKPLSARRRPSLPVRRLRPGRRQTGASASTGI